MCERQMKRDAAADRASDQDRPVELERRHDLEDHGGVLRRGELIFLIVPSRWWRRLAVPGHVEGDDAVPRRNPRIVHQRSVLPPVRARGVQTQQRYALAGLLKINAMLAPEQVEMHVAADDRLECRAHVALPKGAACAPEGRSLASASLK